MRSIKIKNKNGLDQTTKKRRSSVLPQGTTTLQSYIQLCECLLHNAKARSSTICVRTATPIVIAVLEHKYLLDVTCGSRVHRKILMHVSSQFSTNLVGFREKWFNSQFYSKYYMFNDINILIIRLFVMNHQCYLVRYNGFSKTDIRNNCNSCWVHKSLQRKTVQPIK